MWPTAATCGSVKITRGLSGPSAPCEIAVSRPSRSSAAIRAWYLPMCVNSALPLTSPIAYSHGWPSTRMRRSTATGCVGVEPELLEPDPLGLRRAAERHEQRVALGGTAVGGRDDDRAVALGDARRLLAAADVDAVATRAPPSPARTRTPPRAGAAAARPRSASTCEPSVWNACAISTPTTPPPMITSRSGIVLVVVASRLVHASSIASRPSIGGIDGVDPVARITARVASISSSPTRTRRSPVSTPTPRSSAIFALLEPRQLRRVVEVVDDLVAPGEHRRHVERAGDRLRRAAHAPRLRQRLVRAQQRLGRHARPERALAAHQPVLHDRDAQPFVRKPPRGHLAGRPGPDHHYVEGSHPRSRPLFTKAATMDDEHTPGDDTASTWSVRRDWLRVEVPEAS